jgi:ABC-type transport system involved in Fe-S cluster assembly fused permease/ATPase subunit
MASRFANRWAVTMVLMALLPFAVDTHESCRWCTGMRRRSRRSQRAARAAAAATLHKHQWEIGEEMMYIPVNTQNDVPRAHHIHRHCGPQNESE